MFLGLKHACSPVVTNIFCHAASKISFQVVNAQGLQVPEQFAMVFEWTPDTVENHKPLYEFIDTE